MWPQELLLCSVQKHVKANDSCRTSLSYAVAYGSSTKLASADRKHVLPRAIRHIACVSPKLQPAIMSVVCLRIESNGRRENAP